MAFLFVRQNTANKLPRGNASKGFSIEPSLFVRI